MTVLREITDMAGPQLTIDGRRRVAQVITLGDYKSLHDYASLYFDEVLGGGASASTYSVSDGGYTMAVSANGQYIIRQTKQFHRYVSGNTQLVEITFDNLANAANVVKRVGYYNGGKTGSYNTFDGFYLEADGTDYNLVTAKGGSLTSVGQSSWNQDSFDGSGASGITIDFTKFQVFVIDFLYLGGAAVRFGFVLEGVVRWAHVYYHANSADGVFVESPQQPIRYEIRSTGGTSDFVAICSRVASEGESGERVGITHAVDMGTDTMTGVGTTKAASIGIRLKEGRENMSVEPLSVSVLGLSNNDYYGWQLQINPTTTGSWGLDWSSLDDDSKLDVAFASGGTYPTVDTDGEIISSGKGTEQTAITLPLDTALK